MDNDNVLQCEKQYLQWLDYFPNVRPFYTVKTHTNSCIIKIIENMGGGFNCSSINELDVVLSACPNINCSKRIIYSRSCKPISDIKYFKDRNVELTVVDNGDEMLKLKNVWPNAKIFIRLIVNDSESLIPLPTKFDVNDRITIRLFQLAKTLNFKVTGCAFYIGTKH
jgi:ornithine decarboxylase